MAKNDSPMMSALGGMGRLTELRQRLLFVAGALLVFRIGMTLASMYMAGLAVSAGPSGSLSTTSHRSRPWTLLPSVVCYSRRRSVRLR